MNEDWTTPPDFRAAERRAHRFICRSFRNGVFMMETTHADERSLRDEQRAANDCGRSVRMWFCGDDKVWRGFV